MGAQGCSVIDQSYSALNAKSQCYATCNIEIWAACLLNFGVHQFENKAANCLETLMAGTMHPFLRDEMCATQSSKIILNLSWICFATHEQ